MKRIIRNVVDEALQELWGDNIDIDTISYQINRAKSQDHGDLATNVSLILAKKLKRSPLEIANEIKGCIKINPLIEKIEVAAPGFINFFFSVEVYYRAVINTIAQGDKYGESDLFNGEKVHLEFVSVNPTGPLHVGHGRNAAYGSVLANCLEACGYKVHREYYVNDSGRQMDILAVSVFLRYLELHGEIITFPANGYKGGYVFDIAKELINKYGREYFHKSNDILDKLPPDENADGDKEKYIDSLITRCKMILGADNYWQIHQFVLNTVLSGIRKDLEEFGVYQEWFSEQSLLDQNAVEDAIDLLRRKECVYEKDHALWFSASKFGDEKDRVLIRANGQYTYFATDIANHYNKYLTDYAQIIDVLGADHHGYIPRMRAAINAMGLDVNKFHVRLVQFATLFRGEEQVQMSTRSGSFVTLKDLQNEVGTDAARFFYIMRKSEHHMDFDIELAKSKTSDNPVYYIQYAHARICSVFRQLSETSYKYNQDHGLKNLSLLTTDEEIVLMKELLRYAEVVELSAIQYAPHLIAQYLKELATAFHGYYNSSKFIVEQDDLRDARLCLISATRQVLYNGLTILGVTSPETM